MALWQKLLAFFPKLAKGNSGAAPSVDWTKGTTQSMTLNSATVTPTFVSPPGGTDLKLFLTQDGTGGRVVSWPGSVTWIGNGPPSLFSAAGSVTEVLFYFDGTTYFGSIVTSSIPDTAIPWTADILPASSPFTPSASQRYVAVNTTTGAVTVKTPLAPDGVSLPKDGQELVIKATAASATPITVNANGAGVTVEDPSNGGTFGANGTIQAVGGGATKFKYRASDKKWFAYGSF
jgi:hypothetical protein